MNHRIYKTTLAAFALAMVLCACTGTKEEAAPETTEEQTETTESAETASESQAQEETPVTTESLFAAMRSHEKTEAYTTVNAKVSMVDDNAAVKIPVGIELGAEMNMRGSVRNMHIEGNAGVSALILNYDYPFETYAVTTGDGLSLYLYQNETDSWAKFENVADTGTFSEGGSFLSMNGDMFETPVLSEEADAYVIRAYVSAERVSTLLFNPGLIDITALESLGFSLKDIRFNVELYFDKTSKDITSMRIECPEEAEINGFTMESFVVETKYLAFDSAVEEVTLPPEVSEEAVAIQ